jgi:hypothetical protein
VTLLLIHIYDVSAVGEFLAAAIVFRTLTLPGVLLTQYYDYFTAEGYTYWSHVRLLNVLVPTPSAYVGDPNWPKLGYIIGENVQRLAGNNANAHLFADTGAAAAGSVGVLIISIVLAIWLICIDKASRGWDKRYVILVLFPPSLFLTNGPLFTILAGYGGLFWLLAFYLHKPNQITRSRFLSKQNLLTPLN